MKLAIIGEGSLGVVTRNCCSEHCDVEGMGVSWAGGAFGDATDALWFCEDVPLSPAGEPDNEGVISRILFAVEGLKYAGPVLISSQLPVGTVARLESVRPDLFWCSQPENIRVASGVADFSNQARVVVGRRSDKFDPLFQTLFAPFTKKLILTDPETAEMTKHTLNCWLGLNIAFINEIARVAAEVGGDASTISEALLCERRISPNAPLKPGKPFGGGHLDRDIHSLSALGNQLGIPIPLIQNIRRSNSATLNPSLT